MSGSYLLEILMKSRCKILKINCVLAYFCILITSGPEYQNARVFLHRGVSSLNGIALYMIYASACMITKNYGTGIKLNKWHCDLLPLINIDSIGPRWCAR